MRKCGDSAASTCHRRNPRIARHRCYCCDDCGRHSAHSIRRESASSAAHTGDLTRLHPGLYAPQEGDPAVTAIGAIPGAMPILLGWVAIRGRVDWQAALLFAIFFWQFPHFHAISLLYADDYRRGDIRMLPVVEPNGISTRRRIVAYSFVLLVATLLPTLMHMTGRVFGFVALALGMVLIVQSFRIAIQAGSDRPGARIEAHRMLLATVVYLPILMIAFLFDHAIEPLFLSEAGMYFLTSQPMETLLRSPSHRINRVMRSMRPSQPMDRSRFLLHALSCLAKLYTSRAPLQE